MVTVEKATSEMNDAILDLLAEFNNPEIKRDDWLKILDYQWNKEGYSGYVLKEGNEISGFLGLIFSTRTIDNAEHKFANITSWIVRESFRKYSLMLFKPILELKDYTVTALTTTPSLVPFYQKIGFKILDTRSVVLISFPLFSLAKNKITITTDNKIIKEKLNPVDRNIFNDHQPFRCNHILLYDNVNYCYIISAKRMRKGISINQLHYISNLNLFKKYLPIIKSQLYRINHSVILTIDERLLKGDKLKFSVTLAERAPKLYFSELPPEKVDNLYSEYILLNL